MAPGEAPARTEWSSRPGAAALSLPEQVADALGAAIIEGRLGPGERIHEQTIAESFSVSRGPAREALRILERDGLVRFQARRGAHVAELTADEVAEVFEIRAALLGVAARRLASSQAGYAAIGADIARLPGLARDGGADAYVDALQRIELALAQAGGNTMLHTLLFPLAHRTVRYTRLALAVPARRTQSARLWRRLWSAIETADPAAAQQLAEALVLAVRDAALTAVRAATIAAGPAPRTSRQESR